MQGARRPELFDLTWETLPAALSEEMPSADTTAVIAGYRELQPDIEPAELYFTAATDATFLANSIELADRKAMQSSAPVYVYLFNWNTPVSDGKWMSPHQVEIGFVFDNVATSESMSGIGPDQQQIADMMSEAWIAFARYGDPNVDALPVWVPYDPDRQATMVIDLTPELVDAPRRAQLGLLGKD